ncbi:MAG: MBL fold metallo-hydrolase [Candidatus Hydrogenedentes bacterium]|nr:MBL fold metallo-hydrolase [Candidatus Hydrogenedentota bacterium]
MRITSYGAARGVTGSKHLVEVNGHRILLDCGMFQGHRKEAAEKNRDFPFNDGNIDVVILSHAHIDHSGTLPMLARHGFRGQVFTTPATRDLCAIMLLDSAHIQERDARWLSKKEQTFTPPLYTDIEVREIMRHFICVPYDVPLEVVPGVRVTFKDAGHVLGSAMPLLEFQENGKSRRLIFSGDIGQKNMPILKDPWEPDDADVVLMEGTYGDRDHDPIETVESKLADVVNRTHARGGKVIVPTFALERAQEFVYALKRLEMKNRIPEIPVFVDSPLTVNITEVFRLHTDLFDDQMRDVMEASGDPFELKHIEYIRNREASMRLNDLKKPAIILSAAGMCEHGRILHHLRNNCEDEKNTILIIGFQAKNTLGRRIVERQKEIKIFGIKHELMAEVKTLNALSAHAGRTELIAFGKRFKDRAEKLLLVHGEDEALESLLAALQEEGCSNAGIQEEAEPVEL